MDLSEISSCAVRLLSATTQFGGPVDNYTIIGQTYESDPTWHQDQAKVRLNMRALNLLEKAGYLVPAYGGGHYEVSELGRKVIGSSLPLKFHGNWYAEWAENELLLDAINQQRSSTENEISQITVKNWRQFSDVDIIFHHQLTILTGANGAGKTTLLNILAPHFNWSAQLLTLRSQNLPTSTGLEVGQIVYSNGTTSPLWQSAGAGISNAPISISQMQQVPGLFINSHRSISTYQPLHALPPRFSEWETLQNEFASEIQARYSGGNSQYPPLYRMKEALVAAAMYAYGNMAVRPNSSAKELWEGYQNVLRRFLPPSLQFERLAVEDSEIILVTKSSEFPLEAASGGISAMLELSWQIFLRQRNQPSFIVCIDEPENQLHPELQRSIVPSLLAGFPDVTFIIATHSPLVVTSVQDSHVYALGVDSNGMISSRLVKNINTSATPDETLMSVLGLDSTLPIWAESQLSELLNTLPPSPSADDLRSLRDQLVDLGLDRQFPAAVRSLDARK